MTKMLNGAKTNMGFILVGLALQSVAAFTVEWMDDYRVGIMGFAAGLLILGQWNKIKGETEK